MRCHARLLHRKRNGLIPVLKAREERDLQTNSSNVKGHYNKGAGEASSV